MRQGAVLSMISHRLQFINVVKHRWDGLSSQIAMTVLINDEEHFPVGFDDVWIYNEHVGVREREREREHLAGLSE